MIQPHDEPILKQLTDIKIKYDEDLSYTLEFFFEANEYFTDSVSSKRLGAVPMSYQFSLTSGAHQEILLAL